MWALGWWPRAADGLTEEARMAAWQRDQLGNRDRKMKKRRHRAIEREERGEDRGRDALGRNIQDTQKRVGTQRMTKMQKVCRKLGVKPGDSNSERDECGRHECGRGL